MTVTWEEKLRKTEEIATVRVLVINTTPEPFILNLAYLYIQSHCYYLCLQERQKQLESMGISLETSGIKVGEDKCFLVNLNADPALNELLVYYLKVIQFHSVIIQQYSPHYHPPAAFCH